MSIEEEKMQNRGIGTSKSDSCTSISDENLDPLQRSDSSTEKADDAIICRVCHCSESDIRGDAALEFLHITPPSQGFPENDIAGDSQDKLSRTCTVQGTASNKISQEGNDLVQFVSPEGEVFVCTTDIESGSFLHHDAIINLGCSCKNDLSHAHYACALKWFISHGSTVCEICGSVAKNIQIADFRKVVASLKDYEELRDRTATGEPAHVTVGLDPGVDPDAVAAIRRQRLCEISLWFNPQNNSATISQLETVEEMPYSSTENVVATETQINKSALERTGILVATGLFIVILLWIIAPRVGKKGAKFGFHILLGGLCALAVVIFVRFVAQTRFNHGPTRYWAILFVFWFLGFAIWAFRTHSIRTT